MLMVTSLLLNLEAKFSKREAMLQAELSQKESISVYSLLCICFKHFIII